MLLIGFVVFLPFVILGILLAVSAANDLQHRSTEQAYSGLHPYDSEKALQGLKKKFKGNYHSRSFGGYLSIPYAGMEAVVEQALNGAYSVTVKPANPFPGRLHVRPTGLFSSIQNFFGDRDIVIGDNTFDALYDVRGAPEAFVKGLLGSDCRSIIRTLGRKGRVDLIVSPQRFQMRLIPGENLGRIFQESLEALVSGALRVIEMCLRSVPTEGIIFESAAPDLRETACQVCGTELSGAVVACISCRTLHHKDCWEFNGRCSTYACGCTSSQAP